MTVILLAILGYCMDNNMILPPHSSHLTQPLDVGVFGGLKKVMASKLEPLLRTSISRIQKVEWMGAFVKVHEELFRAQNILGGSHGTGIHPYVPFKVLHQVLIPSLLDLQHLHVLLHHQILSMRQFSQALQLISMLYE